MYQTFVSLLAMDALMIFTSFDKIVTENLKKCEVISRPGAGNGLFSIILIPVQMWISSAFYKVSTFYLATTALSTGLLLYSVLLVVLSDSSKKLRETRHVIVSVSVLTSIFTNIYFGTGYLIWILSSILFTIFYSWLFRWTLVKLPRCFTLGEAVLVTQAFTLFSYATVLKIHHSIFNVFDKDEDICYFVAQTGLLTVTLIIAQSYWTYKNVAIFSLTTGSLVIALFVFFHVVLRRSSIVWLLIFITKESRLMLISSWLVFVLIAVFMIRHHTASGGKASTATRKVFHLLAVAVYLPGLLLDIHLMVIASAIALAVLLLVEMLRKTEVLPFSDFLNEAFSIYSDEKDIGGISLTPIYLLVGVACPLALVPVNAGVVRPLQLLSGVLSIGIGDAVASWVGSRYGNTKWKGSERTVEGTLSNIASQYATIFILSTFGVLNGEGLLYKGAAAAVVSGLTEAFTDQVDNLILPMVSLLVLTIL